MKLSFKHIWGDSNAKEIKRLRLIVEKINALEPEISSLSDDDFPKQTEDLKTRLSNGESLSTIIPRAFALVREASKRTLGQRHYDVQLIGGLALNEGKIAEMRTGEGKTLVATLAVYMNALYGRGVHVVTVNDYLARRDAAWMGQIYNFLGLSIGILNDQESSFLYDPSHKELDKDRDETGSFHIVHEFLRPSSRREAYHADITYGTNSQFGFDYLRDNLSTDTRRIVQRGHAFAVIDEVDSILIDEARTPLIISSEDKDSDQMYRQFATLAKTLTKETDFTVDEKLKAIQLTDAGIERAEKALGISNLYTEAGIKMVHHLETAVRARALFEKDKDYVVQNDEIVIVDAFTGRLQPGRRWSDGLHQAVEAKEGVSVQKETKTVASITYQNYFKLYEKISGMTGTAQTSAEEFYSVYKLDVISIPTNKDIKRIDRNDFIFQTEKGKFSAIAKQVKELQEKGQPVLIGTISIEKSELLSAYLIQEGVKHEVLNAKNHEREGEIIAQAGRKGSVIVATNMAGRGVDIILGGNPAVIEQQDEVRSLGGLFVLGTERHEARRIDNQLRGRAGRQGDPGETQFYVSLEDDLMRVFAPDSIRRLMGRFGIPEDQPIENKFINRALETAQTRIEGFHFDARKHTLEYDNVMNHQRKTVYDRRQKLLFGNDEDTRALLATLIDEESIDALIAKKASSPTDPAFWDTIRRIALYVSDLLWTEHLESMDYMRQSVNLRAYGQREPLVEYKKEGLRMFKEMEQAFKDQVLDMIERIEKTDTKESILVTNVEATPVPEAKQVDSTDSEKKVGRNDPCPCGSGKKYKKCHGA